MLGVRIQERMAGYISFNERPEDLELESSIKLGVHYPFEFSLSAFCHQLNFPFQFNFKGSAYFPGLPLSPHLKETQLRPSLSGEMKINPIRGVCYDFIFNLEGYGNLKVVGCKNYKWGASWTKLRSSLITLPIKVFKNEKLIATGEVVYLNPLYHFPLGVSLCGSACGQSPRKKLIDQFLIWNQIINLDYPTQFDQVHVKDQFEQQVNRLPFFQYFFFRLLFFILNIFCFLLTRKGPDNLSEDEKNKIIYFLEHHPVFYILSLPIIIQLHTITYSDRRYLQKKGQNIVEVPTKNEINKWDDLVFSPTVELSRENLEVDVVVIGSGAGGAAMAYELSRKGHAVAIVEEGHFFKRKDFNGIRTEMMNRLYRNLGLTFPISNTPFWIPTGKSVGGTTTINSGTVFRTPKRILEIWEKEFGLDEKKLEKYFLEVEQMLMAKKVPTHLQGGIAAILEKGLANQDLSFGPLTRAEEGCDGQSFCISGCPTGAKRSTNVSYIPEALKNNAFLFTHYQVQKIILENGQAKGIKAKVKGFDKNFELNILAKKVVLAAGTFETPKILHASGLKNSLPALGKNLSIHPALTLGALFDHQVREKLYVPQSLGVFGFEHNDYVLEGYTLPIDSISSAFPIMGKKLQEFMSEVDHFTNFSSMIVDPQKGKMIFTPFGIFPYYWVNQKLISILIDSTIQLGTIFFNGGAKKLLTPIRGHQIINNISELHLLKKTKFKGHDFVLSAHHPLGTCRMGQSPKDSVVNINGQVWGTENLFIADGSVIPGPLGANPQVSIMANALRIANHIHEGLDD